LHLGNVFKESLDEILAGPKAKKIVEGFRNRKLVEPLCRTCGYIQRF
ncbi:MAG: SPASM domain-containing protein, partial [Vallitaleaceae bacterium]|nr:SPASM domain-containing protein [Vallitaleaceae bacterium]